ncbi:phosphatase PAP2 family protein [Pedobacter sp. HMF7647]|uniref:Phosphatase PAP2 family protein n=1 Tax=Hufsiella arboris TaxID=2695275 RepID=A0A7K1Y7D9_9SPHI|nr:phosphatase PAP2 family protein [Hufsiella arboris]MXV50476.1 phosphatase PAP2 family protein [Hufsiella arboris]
MISSTKKIYKKVVASLLLLTVESLLSLLLFGLAIIGFLYIVDYIFVDNNHLFDEQAFSYTRTLVSPRNNNLMVAISFLGDYQFLIAANLLLMCFFLFVRKHRWYSIRVPAIALSSVLMMLVLKKIFNRHRPLTPLLDPARGLSFPSGHAMSSVTFYGLIIFFIWNTGLKKPIRIGLIFLLTLLILSIGFSRIYLQVHYATDVIAGFCMGTIWLIISITTLTQIEKFSKKKAAKSSDLQTDSQVSN